MRSHHSGVAIPLESGAGASTPATDGIGVTAESSVVGEFGLRVARAGRIERRVLAVAPLALAVLGVSIVLFGSGR